MSDRKKQTLKVLDLAEAFYYELCLTFKKCDKEYRNTVVSDLRHKSEEMLDLIKKANDLKGGNPIRTDMQYKAGELLSDIRTVLPAICRLCTVGSKNEARLMKCLDSMTDPLNNWYIAGLKQRAGFLEGKLQEVTKKLNQAKSDYEKIDHWFNSGHDTAKVRQGLDESQSYVRVMQKEYLKARDEYDFSVKQLYEKEPKHYTIMQDVLKYIDEEQKNSKN